MYDRDLEKDITDDVGGDFGKLMRSIASGGRDMNRNVNHESAKKEAQELYDVI